MEAPSSAEVRRAVRATLLGILLGLVLVALSRGRAAGR
jgi:hypothetical protein